MKRENVISSEVLEIVQLAINRNENWMAYNNSLYFIDKDDVHFFKEETTAQEFAADNISDHDHFNIIRVQSIADVLRQIQYGEVLNKQLDILSSKTLSIMNEKNFEYLKDNIKYMGFGEKQHDSLEQHLKEGKESFQLRFNTEVNKKPFEAVLQFRKSDNSDMYFFNSYQASLKRSNNEKVDQTFYLTKGKGVTAKEAYNLLEGRAVFKELSNKAGEPYKAWIQLDFDNKDKNDNNEVKQYHENYGYDLKAAVGKFSVAEMDGGEKEKSLMHSLQKGNIQSVTIGQNGESQKMFIEANPQYKTVNIFNDKMQRLNQEQRLGILEKQGVKESKEEKVIKEDKSQDIKQETKKSVKQKPGDDLDKPKKKNSRKKGLSM
jgi:hypothetical protein